jgi:hypothetical protein
MSKKNPAEEVLIKKALPNWLVVLIFVVGVAIGFSGFWLGWRYMNKDKQQVKIPTPVVSDANPPGNVSLPTTTETTPTESVKKEDFILREDTRAVNLDVKWSTPRQLSYNEALKLLAPKLCIPQPCSLDTIESLLRGYLGRNPLDEESNVQSSTLIWHMGVVQSGSDKNNDVYLLQEVEEGLGYWYTYTYLMESAEGPSVIYSIGGSKSQFKDFQSDQDLGSWPIRAYAIQMPNAKISSLKYDDQIVLQNGKKLQKTENRSSEPGYRFIVEQDPDVNFSKVATTRDGKNVFERITTYSDRTIHEGCLYLFGPDGSVVKYTPTIPKTTKEEPYWGEVTVPSIIWNDGAPNTEAYEFRSTGGCGYSDCLNIVSSEEVGSKSELKIVGKTTDSDTIYAPTSINNTLIKRAYDSWYVPEGKPDIETFLKRYPNAVLLWQDPVGRWAMLQMKNLMPQAECGKPVIYLYPKETTKVSVALPRFINVTVSEPTYPAGGWKVLAKPDGTLSLTATSTSSTVVTYGSLYWEGTGVGYVSPKDGFVIKDGQQQAFLSAILLKYGLNKKEASEFMDFWLPKMTGAPYYRVSFLTNTWSAAAPLYVNPKPDTSIRIFMDWQKLSAPIKITPPQIITPVRNGFTLVEWGGLLYK